MKIRHVKMARCAFRAASSSWLSGKNEYFTDDYLNKINLVAWLWKNKFKSFRKIG